MLIKSPEIGRCTVFLHYLYFYQNFHDAVSDPVINDVEANKIEHGTVSSLIHNWSYDIPGGVKDLQKAICDSKQMKSL